MTRAYDEAYVPDAMQALGEFFDYAVNDHGAEGDEIADLFCMSALAQSFGRGEPWAVVGLCGCELFVRLSREFGYDVDGLVEPGVRMEKTPEYWLGWVAAYVQWRLGVSFDTLFSAVPYDEFLALYTPWHESSEERVAALVAERLRSVKGETRLAKMRKRLGLSQRALAYRAGVSLRSIQMYEQRNKDINRAQVGSVAELARVLHCCIEDLLEVDVGRLDNGGCA